MIDEDFKEHVLKTLIELLNDRLLVLEEHRKYNNRIDKEILDTRNDLKRYKNMLEKM